MSHPVLLLVLLAALLHATWNALLRGGRDRFWGVTVMSSTAGLVCLLTLPFLPLPNLRAWPYVIGSGIVHINYNLLLVRQYRQGDFGHTYPVSRGSSPMLIAIGGSCSRRNTCRPRFSSGSSSSQRESCRWPSALRPISKVFWRHSRPVAPSPSIASSMPSARAHLEAPLLSPHGW